MPPEAREAVAAVPGPQPERVAQARGSPSLAATLGPDADYRLSRALGDAAPHRKSFETQRHVAHAVLVVAEIHQVLPQLLNGGGFELGVSLVEPKLDGVDGTIAEVEVALPDLELRPTGRSLGLDELERLRQALKEMVSVDSLKHPQTPSPRLAPWQGRRGRATTSPCLRPARFQPPSSVSAAWPRARRPPSWRPPRSSDRPRRGSRT